MFKVCKRDIVTILIVNTNIKIGEGIVLLNEKDIFITFL